MCTVFFPGLDQKNYKKLAMFEKVTFEYIVPFVKG